MRVKTINGTAMNTCACGNWLNHWMKVSREPLPPYCPERCCRSRAEVGAHVQKENSGDASWYIVPLCREHNSEHGRSLTISDNVTLVPADVNRTCART